MEIKRDHYLNILISKKHNNLIKVVTGMRRCGKSYLLFNLFREHLRSEGVRQDHIIEIAFDSFENKPFRDPNVLYPHLKAQITDDDMYYTAFGRIRGGSQQSAPYEKHRHLCNWQQCPFFIQRCHYRISRTRRRDSYVSP